MMLFMIPPIKVSKYWETIKYALVKSLEIPEQGREATLNTYLMDILSGDSQCWFGVEKVNGAKQLNYIVLTTFLFEEVTSIKHLLIKMFYPMQDLPVGILKEFKQYMVNFAKANDCRTVQFETNNALISETAKVLNFNEVSKRFLFEVPNGNS